MNTRSGWRILFFRLLGILAIAVVLPLVIQAVRIVWFSGRTAYTLQPFTQNTLAARIRILFIGDSTAVGTGAASNQQSVAGWTGKYWPHIYINNWGENGLRLVDLVDRFQPVLIMPYRAVIIQIGGNDILRFSDLAEMEKNLTIVIERAQRIGERVVILHSGNVGLAPVFIWPFDWILTQRTRAVRDLYMRTAKETGAVYIDLFTERDNDPFFRKDDVPDFYGPDYLHPSGLGYHWWYTRFRQTLDKAYVHFD
ncbi:MAG: hypothetical protein A3D10_02410 [Omnitrophica WOR_2 bacterium RIFCSPHIGHO2_02_FULL_48_11]|nr:MAG: hypothetical protein A3D10_02410 [Omnitrophica WOR_2 bacterium RIFCSPHIGHO2_02_FULL_48_11]